MKILFIVPYPELRETVERVVATTELPSYISLVADVHAVENIEQLNPAGYDAIIARGYTSKYIRRTHPGLINIDLDITSYDIIRSFQKIASVYKPHKVAYCGGYKYMEACLPFSDWLGCPLGVYYAADSADIKKTVLKAVSDGCDLILGGFSAANYAREAGVTYVVIETGEESVREAVASAVQSVEIKRNEQVKAEMYRMITKNSTEGIFFVNTEKFIGVDNRTAHVMSGSPVALCGKRFDAVFPELAPVLDEVFNTRHQKTVDVVKLSSGISVTVTVTPVIGRGELFGAVVNMVNITYIQALEGSIRKKLSDKGLVARYHFEDIKYRSAIMSSVTEEAKRFACTEANIMIVGETGTGKELFAQSIHNESRRKSGPFVAVNCAALPENLLESELFGYEEGAFTGSKKGGKPGLVEQAHGGTLFLDEIAEIPINLQSKLLRVIQEREVRRIGSDKVINVDIRIIAATNRNLSEEVSSGRFRQDLLYRLDVLRLFLPPLGMRREDIVLLFEYMTGKFSKAAPGIYKLDANAERLLTTYDFKGNVRELRNIAERLCALCGPGIIDESEIKKVLYPSDVELMGNRESNASGTAAENIISAPPGSLSTAKESAEYDRIIAARDACMGNRGKMAELLKIDRSTLWRKMKHYGIS